MEEIIRHLNAESEECYFWATHANAELDLLIIKNGKKLGFEIKYTDKPKLTKSMHMAMQDLNLDSLTLIYPGTKRFPLMENVEAVGLDTFLRT